MEDSVTWSFDSAGEISREEEERGPVVGNSPFIRSTWSGDVKECAICQVEYEGADQVLVLPCKHFFHRSCILRYVPFTLTLRCLNYDSLSQLVDSSKSP